MWGVFSENQCTTLNKKTMARKTAKDYRKEYKEVTNQVTALESRIRARLEFLCITYPNVPTGAITTAKDIEESGIHKLNIDGVLMYIERIETELAKKDKHTQTELF
jgi:hypothetical protein